MCRQHIETNTELKPKVKCFQSQRRPSVGGVGGHTGLRHAEAYAANTTAEQLRRGAWPALLARCGDALMLHLLLHASLFAPLPNGCLLQLSGPAAADVRY